MCDLIFPFHDILVFFNCQPSGCAVSMNQVFCIIKPAYLSPSIINPFYFNYFSISRANHPILIQI